MAVTAWTNLHAEGGDYDEDDDDDDDDDGGGGGGDDEKDIEVQGCSQNFEGNDGRLEI